MKQISTLQISSTCFCLLPSSLLINCLPFRFRKKKRKIQNVEKAKNLRSAVIQTMATLNFQPIFETERLRIRLLEKKDLGIFAENRAIPIVAQYQGWETSYTLEDAEVLLAQQNELIFGADDTWFQLAIEVIETGEYVGDLAVHFIDEHQVEIGFTLVLKHQKLGYGREAARGLVEYLCHTMGKRRIIATTDAKNDAAANLLTNIGMRKEASFIENVFFKGEWGSEFAFGILASEL